MKSTSFTRLPLRRLVGLALMLAVVLTACGVGVEGAPEVVGVQGDDEVSGDVEVLIATYPDHTETLHYLETEEGRHVRVLFDVDPGTLQSGEYLELSGRWDNTKSNESPSFTATGVLKHLGVDHQALDGSSSGSTSDIARALREPMLHRTAVLLLGDTKYTRKQAREQVNPNPGSAAAYLEENSDGIDSFEGDAFGPFNVNTSNCGSRVYEIRKAAINAAKSAGVDLDRYNKLAIVIPGDSGCGWGGLGQVWSPGSTRQATTWYNNWFSCGVVAHELGHNLGLNHSHSTHCDGQIYRSGRKGCSDIEYGNVFDVMGQASCDEGHFSSAQKQYMGWLDDCEDVTAAGTATFNISPVEGPCGIRSLRIPIRGENNYYYLEYRKVDAGEFGGARGADRVLLSVSNDGTRVKPDPFLLDSTPNTSGSGRKGRLDSWLQVGRDYNLPGNVRIRVLAVGDQARVRVTTDRSGRATCHGGSVPPSTADGSFGVGCSDGCPNDPDKVAPGHCGCGVADEDRDGDGVYDCDDRCPSDPNKSEPGECGCGTLELECGDLERGLERAHYNGSWSSLPNFDELSPDEETITSAINVEDFAGTDNFGVVFTGGLRIDTAGTYEFELGSDDGSRLRIGIRDVVVNDGLHGFSTVEGRIRLGRGVHALRVEFFERRGGERLRLRYRRSGGSWSQLPAAALFHSATGNDACPDDPDKTQPGICGCGVAETDRDGDGSMDCEDGCPTDANKTSPGECGCGVAEGTCTGGGAGRITYQVWTGTSGGAVAQLTARDDFPDNPSSSDTLTSFEAPKDWGDNYGSRIVGYLHAPVTGSYRFWIASDDNGELWLSTDDSPQRMRRIAHVPGWTSSRQWGKYPEQRSVWIQLTAGRRYYIEALHNEGGGGDNLAVAWRRPGAGRQLIAGEYLSPLQVSDQCPDDPNKTAPGICGCGVSDRDSDGDGTADCQDGCDLPVDHGSYCSDPACGPCAEGQGDCDRDSDCRGDLVCRSREDGGDPAQPGHDICVSPGPGGDGVDDSDQWSEGDPNIEAEGRFVLFHNGQEKGVSCEENGARPRIVSQPRVWRVFKNRRLKDMTSGWELDCPEGVYRCTCRGSNQGEWFHGGDEERGKGPVHNSLLSTNQGRPIYPDADSRYTHICLTVDGEHLTAADNDPGVCSRFTFKNWRKIP